jgi:hypothetical protein
VPVLQAGRHFRPGGRPANGLSHLLPVLWPVRWSLVVAFVAALLGVVVGLAQPGFVRAFMDSVLVSTGSSDIAVPLLLAMSGSMMATTGLVAVGQAELLRARVSGATCDPRTFIPVKGYIGFVPTDCRELPEPDWLRAMRRIMALVAPSR